RHSSAAETKLAYFHQPCGRGDDAVCRNVRRHVPHPAHWAALAGGVLALPSSAQYGSLAAVPQSADLGRVRGIHLFHGFTAVLVYRLDSGYCHSARQCEAPYYPRDLWCAVHGLARLGPALVPL